MNIPKNFWTVTVTAMSLLIAFLAAMTIKELKSISYVGVNQNTISSISVDGTGEVLTKPDVATFSFTVSETAATVADAQNKATTQINNALKAVKDGGVSSDDIQTTSYNINPHYEYQDGVCAANSICRPGKQVLTGYDVSQTTEVKVRDLTKAGTLFASIGSSGVENVNGLNFSIDKPEAVKSQARDMAIADAEAKAKDLAKNLGVSLVRVISFSENGQTPGPIAYGMDNMMSMKAQAVPAAAPEISVGQNKVTSDVTITYEIH